MVRQNLALLEGFAATPNGLVNAVVRPITDAASNDLYNAGIGSDLSPEQNRERNNQIVGTVGGVASMFTGKLPTRVPDVSLGFEPLPTFRFPLEFSSGRSVAGGRKAYYPGDLTSHPRAHALKVHGGDVTDAELIHRSRTGVKPDGTTAGVPKMSSAFHSDDYLRWVDRTIRESGALKAAAARRPDQPNIKVTVRDVGDLGVDVGRGYKRILDSGNKLDNQRVYGATERVGGLRSAEGYYRLNPLTGRW